MVPYFAYFKLFTRANFSQAKKMGYRRGKYNPAKFFSLLMEEERGSGGS